MDPAGVAAALGDRRHTGIALQIRGRGIALVLLAERGEQAWAEDRACGRESKAGYSDDLGTGRR
jgi:hypothetical protein